MAEHITKCVRCGSLKFIVVETTTWRGELDDKGLLACAFAENEIDNIRCADCNEPYETDRFNDLYFN